MFTSTLLLFLFLSVLPILGSVNRQSRPENSPELASVHQFVSYLLLVSEASSLLLPRILGIFSFLEAKHVRDLMLSDLQTRNMRSQSCLPVLSRL